MKKKTVQNEKLSFYPPDANVLTENTLPTCLRNVSTAVTTGKPPGRACVGINFIYFAIFNLKMEKFIFLKLFSKKKVAFEA